MHVWSTRAQSLGAGCCLAPAQRPAAKPWAVLKFSLELKFRGPKMQRVCPCPSLGEQQRIQRFKKRNCSGFSFSAAFFQIKTVTISNIVLCCVEPRRKVVYKISLKYYIRSNLTNPLGLETSLWTRGLLRIQRSFHVTRFSYY